MAEWKHEWASAFYLIAESSVQKVEEEYLVFDLSDAMNGIGGAMGLFLGWSMLYLIRLDEARTTEVLQASVHRSLTGFLNITTRAHH